MPIRTVTARSRIVSHNFVQVCDKIPLAIEKNHWKLMRDDKQLGFFEAKIGMTFWTYSQTIRINAEKTGNDSTKIKVNCEAPHVIIGRARAQNEKMILRLYRELNRFPT